MGGILSEQTTCFVDAGDSVTAAAVAIAKGKKAVSPRTAATGINCTSYEFVQHEVMLYISSMLVLFSFVLKGVRFPTMCW